MIHRASLCCLCFLVLQAVSLPAQVPGVGFTMPDSAYAPAPAPGYARLRRGLDFYQQSRWWDAVAEFRLARDEAVDVELKAEALYWISLSEISARDYAGAIRDMDQMELIAPKSRRLREIPYHKGRALYYLGRYEEALMLLKMYADRISGKPPAGSEMAARKSAALYWIGECLYAMGQLDYARDIFSLVTQDYPQSAKFEASSYRLALIHQKKIEEELLNLLTWNHEESLKAVEEYQRRERSYDQALIAYQKRIADLLKDSGMEDMDDLNTLYRRQLMEAEARIHILEAELTRYRPAPGESGDEERRARLENIRSLALDLADSLYPHIDDAGSRMED